jgi:hypothetical protein
MAADPIFIDTNVLVFATIPASPFHQAAIAALHDVAISGAAAWISRQVLREYLVQLTSPGVLPVPMSAQIAATQATALESLYRVADGTGTVPIHAGGTDRTLGFACAQAENRLAARAHDLADEFIRRPDFEPLRTPAKLEPRCRIPLADQVHPKRILNLRRQLVRRDRQPLRQRRLAHAGLRRVHPRRHQRLLHQRIRRDDVDRLRPPLGRPDRRFRSA